MNREDSPLTPRQFLTLPEFAYEIRRCAAAFAILIGLSFGAGLVLEELREYVAGWMFGIAENVTGGGESVSFLALLTNNLTACGMTILYGLLPFVGLPALALGMNAVILGVLGAWYVSNGYSLLVYLAGLLPHGLFELPALVLAFAGGMYLSGQLGRRIRKKETAMPLGRTAACLSELYLSIIAPLLIAAAFLETYITPMFLSLFTGA